MDFNFHIHKMNNENYVYHSFHVTIKHNFVLVYLQNMHTYTKCIQSQGL